MTVTVSEAERARRLLLLALSSHGRTGGSRATFALAALPFVAKLLAVTDAAGETEGAHELDFANWYAEAKMKLDEGEEVGLPEMPPAGRA